jgi:hypothetical protein
LGNCDAPSPPLPLFPPYLAGRPGSLPAAHALSVLSVAGDAAADEHMELAEQSRIIVDSQAGREAAELEGERLGLGFRHCSSTQSPSSKDSGALGLYRPIRELTIAS